MLCLSVSILFAFSLRTLRIFPFAFACHTGVSVAAGAFQEHFPYRHHTAAITHSDATCSVGRSIRCGLCTAALRCAALQGLFCSIPAESVERLVVYGAHRY